MSKRKSSDDADLIDFTDFLLCHNLPRDPIDDIIQQKINQYGFPHPLHLKYYSGSRYKMPNAEPNEIRRGPWTDIEKEILARNVEIILNSEPVKSFWSNDTDKKNILIALFGYCRLSKYYNSPFKQKDIFKDQRERMKFKTNLGCGLPDRLLHSCYDWCRRTYNPFREYSEEAYKKSVEDCRKIIKQQPDRYNYIDISAKYEVSLRTIQKIYQFDLTATGEEPYRGLYEPVEDWVIIKHLLHQSQAESYEHLLKLRSKMRFNWKKVSVALNYRSQHEASDRWTRLRSIIRTNADYEVLKNYAKSYHKDLARMIYCLYREKDDLEDQVDWYAMGYPKMSFKYCVARFQHLKTWVPPEVLAKKSHRKTVKWLYKNILPNLTTLDEKRMEKLEAHYRKRFYYNS